MLKLSFTGRLGGDAKVIETNGKKAIVFSVAHNEKFKDAQGTEIERVTWLDCYYPRREGTSLKLVEYLKKGTQIYAEALPRPEIFTVKTGDRAGQPAISFKAFINMLEVQSWVDTPKAEPQPQAQAQTQPESRPPESDSSDLPY